jgi:hypothetical protein
MACRYDTPWLVAEGVNMNAGAEIDSLSIHGPSVSWTT